MKGGDSRKQPVRDLPDEPPSHRRHSRTRIEYHALQVLRTDFKQRKQDRSLVGLSAKVNGSSTVDL